MLPTPSGSLSRRARHRPRQGLEPIGPGPSCLDRRATAAADCRAKMDGSRTGCVRPRLAGRGRTVDRAHPPQRTLEARSPDGLPARVAANSRATTPRPRALSPAADHDAYGRSTRPLLSGWPRRAAEGRHPGRAALPPAADQGNAYGVNPAAYIRMAEAGCRRTTPRPRGFFRLAADQGNANKGPPRHRAGPRRAAAGRHPGRAVYRPPPIRATLMGRSTSAASIRMAEAGCRRTTPRPRGSSASPPIRATLMGSQLGRLYQDGRGGLPKEDTQVAGFSACRRSGQRYRQVRLGILYEQGRGGLPRMTPRPRGSIARRRS